MYDVECGVHTHVGGHEHIFQFVEDIVIDLRLSGNGMRKFVEKAGLGGLQSVVKNFLFFLF